MDRGDLWDLNLDAEFELAVRGSYTRSSDAERFVLEHQAGARLVLGKHDAALGDPELAPEDLRGRVGRAWCPTPSALARLLRVGAVPAPAPSFEILRAVNDRAFCASLGQTLDGAFHTDSLDDLELRLADSEGPAMWLAKRAFGVAGRGRRKLRHAALDESDWNWLRASLRQGGLQLEPWVEVEAEFTIHGELGAQGSLHLGPPRIQLTDSHGAWRESREARADELQAVEAARFSAEAQRVAEALRRAGYFGPFGVDGFRYRSTPSAELRLQVRSEVNARYTMGWGL